MGVLQRHVAERPSRLLLFGFVLAALNLVLGLGFSYYASFVFPVLQAGFPGAAQAVLAGPLGSMGMLPLVFGLLGNILFYSAVFRARIVPRWAALVVIGGQALGIAMPPYNLPVVISCIGLVAIGWSMAAGAAAREPAVFHPAGSVSHLAIPVDKSPNA